jgi:glycine/D-amino acid oxidase-like deaminating enzyme
MAARAAGAKIAAPCAVRGVETRGGRVAAAITEKGRVACDSIVLAGGVWSRLFCGNLGLSLPQLKVMTSVLRTARIAGGPECAASGPGFAFRKHMDGGYVISQSMRNVADIGPDNFRLLREFLPVVRARWKKLHLRAGRAAWREWTTPRHWPLDRPSPFEALRVVDPAPYAPFVDEAFANARDAFPFFRDARLEESWAGMIDVTPDVVPVMSPVDSLPGFFVATGFSGHGFGIGPGAGKLMADLVTGDRPLVDPSPFRFARYAEGVPLGASPLAI